MCDEPCKSFEFKLAQAVTIRVSGEEGVVIGRAEYTNMINQYFVRYCAADDRAVESWWAEDALVATSKVEN